MRLKTRIVSILLFCCLLSALMVFYFLIFFDDKNHVKNQSKTSSLIIVPFAEIRHKNDTKDRISSRIWAQIEIRLPLLVLNETSKAIVLIETLKEELLIDEKAEPLDWSSLAHSWITARQVIPVSVPQLGRVMRALQIEPIVSADVSRSGTQLKLLLELKSGQKVLFKPQRYPRDHIIDGIYAGADRHNGEIIAFHLSRLLDLRFVPIVVSRRFQIAELHRLATPTLNATFLTNGSCFYGECHYCSPYSSVCADDNGLLEGSVHLLLPSKYKLQRIRNPWQRTYRSGVKARWETDNEFCVSISQRLPLRPRLLDIIDVSIFDFLISNADRHHFEVFKDVSNSALLYIDNGKSFGNPFVHEITILAPLYQCCVVRNSTYRRLQVVASAPLSVAIPALLGSDPLWPLLTPQNMQALDFRLQTVIACIETCFQSKGKHNVLK